MKRVKALVSGRVQGVCFRACTRDRAESLEVSGFVRNLPDGRVEILAEGEDDNVNALIEWASHGPSHAEVSGVSVRELEFRGDETGFRVRY
ncbi:MAG: acylphosphatase [Candidatus Fermentibacteraceae bacterium]|nr:acylphosphatase [Candidatus Fermentibacteraceae bacterium]MBN2608786.1 acylphosphatase [Candidatus Fermentibacteraceae bacterium]